MAKRGYVSEGDLAEVISCVLYELKAWLSMADYFCFSMMSSWLVVSNIPHSRSRWPLQAYMFPVSLPMHTYAAQSFCIVFGKKFNTKSGFFVHQPLTLPQKIDSREGLFWYKKGLACECSEMNIYLKKSPFAPTFGPFIAKYSAIWCKTQGKKHKHPLQMYKQDL